MFGKALGDKLLYGGQDELIRSCGWPVCMVTVRSWQAEHRRSLLNLLSGCILFISGCSGGSPGAVPSPANLTSATSITISNTAIIHLQPSATSTATPSLTPVPKPSTTTAPDTPPPPAGPRAANITPTQMLSGIEGEVPQAQPTLTALTIERRIIPKAAILFLTPGPMSKVVSPLTVQAYLPPGHTGAVNVELLGEKPDRPPLVRKTFSFNSEPGGRIALYAELDFEIPGVSEIGRLQVTAIDLNGRTVALASVDLILLSVGPPELNLPDDELEPIFIQNPPAGSFVQGGALLVSGLARPRGDQPLIVELLGENGKHLGPSRWADVEPSQNGQYVSFEVDVPYSVQAPAWALLVVRESAGRIPGVTHLSSVEIQLAP